ncbi:MAG TPA: hypothetical protein VHH33_00505 [Nitrososphaeraceae archaeon]|nr:hypothetical protein [Nitrososphaeraceae archaeon]
MTDNWVCPVCHKELKLKYEYDDYAKYRKWDHYMTHTKVELVTFIEEKETKSQDDRNG